MCGFCLGLWSDGSHFLPPGTFSQTLAEWRREVAWEPPEQKQAGVGPHAGGDPPGKVPALRTARCPWKADAQG